MAMLEEYWQACGIEVDAYHGVLVLLSRGR